MGALISIFENQYFIDLAKDLQGDPTLSLRWNHAGISEPGFFWVTLKSVEFPELYFEKNGILP